MLNKKFEWNGNTPLKNKGVSAEVAHEELIRIMKEEGEDSLAANTETIVKHASIKTSPIHSLFDWEDSVAGRKWRLHQARQIVSSINVVIKDVPTSTPQRAFVHIRELKEYMPILQAMSQEETRDSVLKEAFNSLTNWRNRYKGFKEFSKIVIAIGDLDEEDFI